MIKQQDVIVYYARVIIDFIMPIEYVFYDENVLNYIRHALYRMNSLKSIFVKYRSQNTTHDEDNENETRFNIFKFYIFIY